MVAPSKVVFLLDVDNTLFDNDRFAADLSAQLEQSFGAAQRDRYWTLYAQRRTRLGFADYLGALEDFRVGLVSGHNPGLASERALLEMSAFLLDYPFAQQLYPRALETIAYLHTVGQPAVLSDGDVIFQPRKIQRSGIWEAVAGRVLICVHKQFALESMQRAFPATHYVLVDDKLQLLSAVKQVLGARLTSVFVRQGHYALAAVGAPIDPPPDIAIERIGDLINHQSLHELHARIGSRKR